MALVDARPPEDLAERARAIFEQLRAAPPEAPPAGEDPAWEPPPACDEPEDEPSAPDPGPGAARPMPPGKTASNHRHRGTSSCDRPRSTWPERRSSWCPASAGSSSCGGRSTQSATTSTSP